MENKTGSAGHFSRSGKYFKYAIGEIALVMIGILLALQVNNWNENRKNNIEAKAKIKAIYNDIVNDTLLLSEGITLYEELLPQNNELIDQINSDTANLETFKNVAKKFNPTFFGIDAFNNSTLRSVESTGKLDLINEDLKKELLKYKLMQETNVNTINEKIYLNFANNFSAKYKFGVMRNTYISQLNSTFKDEQEYVNKLSSLIGYKSYMMRYSLADWKETLTKAKSIISLIKAGGDD